MEKVVGREWDGRGRGRKRGRRKRGQTEAGSVQWELVG